MTCLKLLFSLISTALVRISLSVAWSVYTNFGLVEKYVPTLDFPPPLLFLTPSCRPASRWPRTLAGITASLQCTRNTHGSGIYPGSPQDERKAWRRCDRGGFWADDDYSRCQYANDVTRVLYMFNQVTGTSSDVLRWSVKHGLQTQYIRSYFKYQSSVWVWCSHFTWWVCRRNKVWCSRPSVASLFPVAAWHCAFVRMPLLSVSTRRNPSHPSHPPGSHSLGSFL